MSMRLDLLDGAADAAPAWALEPDVVCRSRPQGALEQLGPVLLVRRQSPGPGHAWHLGSVVDAYGVREFVEAARWRLYRLPDSDFLGWERLSQVCEPLPAAPRSTRLPHSRCASLARFASTGWLGVPRVSDVGWDLARTILRLEAAHLCRAAWLELN